MAYAGKDTFYGVRQIHRKEDASAIAAVPDMFKALQDLEYWFNTDQEILDAMDADTRADHERQLGKIRAAIAKAKGLVA
tara:strand:+ start:325 stop:561 length:237 start_codon:yes stop_codon:yes gene_type:complete